MPATTKKKARKPSKVVKPKANPKRTTTSTRNHRFQSFSERIANLKIDPIRRRRNAEDREELSEDTATYFGRSLEEWRDLNLSKTFTAFAREAAPLCDSLPVMLHNEEKIMDLLLSYIEKRDGLALEPLLSLLTHFAHDLDTRFEKYFQRAVATVTAVAASHDDPAVIEWSFTRLAWLFKYLSRVLVPDLRPLYDLMLPYLGKQTQKPHIIRFAAESLSFLVRKAAATYEKDQKPLNFILSHMLQDCQRESHSDSADLHRQGVMTLLTETIKSVQGGIHSAGLAVLQSMLGQLEKYSTTNCEAIMEITTGVLTSLIHHTDAETFKPVFETAVGFATATPLSTRLDLVGPVSQMIFTIATVRKGTRVSDWTKLITVLGTLVHLGQDSAEIDAKARYSVLSAVAVTLQSATIDAILPGLDIFEKMRKGQWRPYFLQFCDLYARLGHERFRSFLLPQFQKFVLEDWNTNVDDLAFLLPRLPLHGQKLACLHALQDWILGHVEGLESASDENPSSADLASANVVLSAMPHLKIKDSTREQVQTVLLKGVRRALETADDQVDDYHNFMLGPCFARLLEDVYDTESLRGLWPALCTTSLRFVQLPRFWSNLLRYIEIFQLTSEICEGSHITQLETALLQCLSLPSQDIRQAALGLLQLIYKLRRQPVPDALSTAATIESTPVNLETSRSISMNIRRLVPAGSNQEVDSLMQRAIPTYCFGILHFKLAQAWDDSVNALEKLSKSAVGEEVITALVQKWLEGESTATEQQGNEPQQTPLDIDSAGFQVASDFECSNLARVSAVCQQTLESPQNGYPSRGDQFQIDTCSVSAISSRAREQALRVLNKIPNIAEKRSRTLVPVLLRWACQSEIEDVDELPATRWARKDQKAMLAVFAQFTNPKVLFKSREVYDALLNLCANGDVEIQRSALKAIYAWKEPAITSYEEHLTNLLDEARFREEISVFLQDAGDGETAIRDEHQDKLIPVLLRLLYGRAVAGSKHGQSSRRKAIFVALSRHGETVLGIFVDIALGTTGNINLAERSHVDEGCLSAVRIPLRQQFGMLNMVNDMLETLGSELQPFATKMLDAAVLCTIAASRQLDQSTDTGLQNASLLRSIRQVGIQCIGKVYSTMDGSTFPSQAKLVLEEVIAPRLKNFASENTQSISGMLRLFSAWCSSQHSAPYLVNHIESILDQVANLLREQPAKDEVRLFVLQDILDNLTQGESSSILGQAQVTSFVRSIGDVLNQQPSKDVLSAGVASLMKLAARIMDKSEADAVIDVCSTLLTKPNKIVSPTTKMDILKTVSPLLDSFDIPAVPMLYDALCGLFSRLQDQQARAVLSEVFGRLCKASSELSQSAQVCEDLNSLGGKLDEPDHERRERGFTQIYEQYNTLSTQQWQPILHNCLFYLRDTDDLVNRSSSSQALDRFILAASSRAEEFQTLLLHALLPGIEYGMKTPSELVRAEYLRLLGRLVAKLPELQAVKDMQCLTVSGDDEASIFANVLHIQQHRRLRALRRLSEAADFLSANNVLRIFIPLLEHFVFDQVEGDAGKTLADQAIHTIGALAKALNWSSFRALFKRYTGYLSSKSEQETIIMRLLSTLVDTLRVRSDALEARKTSSGEGQKSEAILHDFLPPLVKYIHLKDESTVDRRMPVAVTVVKLLLLLPENETSARLAPVLTDVCHVLRSRSQEARDQTRKTLSAILALVGPSYLGFILKELCGALQRGSQLHVLSFTVHSMLVNVVDSYRPGDLDHCLQELTSVIMDDIFGVTGQEKDSEDYRSAMKEVKSSKSFDTLELLARVTPIQRFGQLMKPLRALLSEKVDTKMLRKIDDLLTRLRKGIDQNPAAGSRDVLILCHEIIRQVYAEQSPTSSSTKPIDYKASRYLIRMEASNKSKSRGTTTAQTFKLVSFALDLLRKVLRRHEDLMTPSNLAGLLPVVGDALVQGQEEVQLSAIKLLSTIMKIPLPELEQNAPVYVKEAVRLIKGASSMTTESAKGALELITAVLREKRSVNIKQKEIGEVLEILKGDIDEPDRQGIIYKFLRAVLGRKIMATEVYEIMDEAYKVIVTNPDRTVRESARSAYLQFILEYPQGKDRWNKHAAFFVENLKYEHPAGRQSVMELLHQLMPKLQDDVLEQLAFTLFVALVPVQTSDSDGACRQMAAILIAKLFERVTDEQLDTFLALMRKWLHNEENPTIQVAALRCWTLALRVGRLSRNRLENLRNDIEGLFQATDLTWFEGDTQVAEEVLQLFDALVENAPETAFAKDSAGIWQSLQSYLLVPRTETRLIAAQLLEAFFSHLASSSSKTSLGLSSVPLRGTHGLEMDGNDMRQVCNSSLRVLREKSQDCDGILAARTVRNVVFLGRCFEENNLNWRDTADKTSDEDDDQTEEFNHRDPSALGYLFNRVSYIIRQEELPTLSRIAAVQCQSTLIRHVTEIPDLVSVVKPLYVLTDPAIPQPSGDSHKKLVELARELLEAIQEKVGTEAYISALGAARSASKSKREERRQKRRIDAVSAPEKWAKEKRKRYESKTAKSKAKGMEAMGRRRGW